WFHEEGAVDMALEPGPDLLDWLSPNPAIQAMVYTCNSKVVGYTRIHTATLTKPLVFLAWDHEAARAMIATMIHKVRTGLPVMRYVLPLHPFSASAEVFDHATCSVRASSMACSLGESPLDDYFARLQAGQRPPGRVIWPVFFDLD